MAHACLVEMAAEAPERTPLDEIDGEDNDCPLDSQATQVADAERDLLDSVPMPGVPTDEAERRRLWTAFPQRVRAAIRRVRPQFGHPPTSVLTQVLKAARAPAEYIQAIKHMKCDSCAEHKPQAQTQKVAMPKDFVFGRNVGVDVLEIRDSAGQPYLCLNIVDFGTTFQQLYLLHAGLAKPSSRECLDGFVATWVNWAGWPSTLTCDRGLHNRGGTAQAGVEVSPRHSGSSALCRGLPEMSSTRTSSQIWARCRDRSTGRAPSPEGWNYAPLPSGRSSGRTVAAVWHELC
jgi:hypothetical protein